MILNSQAQQSARDVVADRSNPIEAETTWPNAAQSRLAALIYLITDLTVPESTRAAKVALDKRTLAITIDASSRRLSDPELIEKHLAEVVDLVADAVVSRPG